MQANSIDRSPFRALSIDETFLLLPKIKGQIRLGRKRIAVTNFGIVVGFLVPLSDIKQAESDNAFTATKEISLSFFRTWLFKGFALLKEEIDCVYVSVHTRRGFAFVSTRWASYLPIPVSPVAHILLESSYEL